MQLIINSDKLNIIFDCEKSKFMSINDQPLLKAYHLLMKKYKSYFKKYDKSLNDLQASTNPTIKSELEEKFKNLIDRQLCKGSLQGVLHSMGKKNLIDEDKGVVTEDFFNSFLNQFNDELKSNNLFPIIESLFSHYITSDIGFKYLIESSFNGPQMQSHINSITFDDIELKHYLVVHVLNKRRFSITDWQQINVFGNIYRFFGCITREFVYVDLTGEECDIYHDSVIICKNNDYYRINDNFVKARSFDFANEIICKNGFFFIYEIS